MSDHFILHKLAERIRGRHVLLRLGTRKELSIKIGSQIPQKVLIDGEEE